MRRRRSTRRPRRLSPTGSTPNRAIDINWRRSPDAIEAAFGRQPSQLSADAGYCSDANLAAMEDREIDADIAPGLGQARQRRRSGGARASPPSARRSRLAATPALSLAQAIARAGVRTDQAGARLPSVPAARRREDRRRMGPRPPRPQCLEARSGAGSVPGGSGHGMNPRKAPIRDPKWSGKLPPPLQIPSRQVTTRQSR